MAQNMLQRAQESTSGHRYVCSIIDGLFQRFGAESILRNDVLKHNLQISTKPLILLIYLGHRDGLARLLDAGADPNILQDRDDASEADPSAQTQNMSSVDPNFYIGNAALHMAVYANDSIIMDLLINRGADVNLHNARGQTPLTLAINIRAEAAISCLLSYRTCIDVNVRSKDGLTPLSLAVIKNNLKAVQLLLRCDCDVLLANQDRSTALCLSIQAGQTAIVKLMVSRLTSEMLKNYCQTCLVRLRYAGDGYCSSEHLKAYVYPALHYLYTREATRFLLLAEDFAYLWLRSLRAHSPVSEGGFLSVLLLFDLLVPGDIDQRVLQLLSTQESLEELLIHFRTAHANHSGPPTVITLLVLILLPLCDKEQVRAWFIEHFDLLVPHVQHMCICSEEITNVHPGIKVHLDWLWPRFEPFYIDQCAQAVRRRPPQGQIPELNGCREMRAKAGGDFSQSRQLEVRAVLQQAVVRQVVLQQAANMTPVEDKRHQGHLPRPNISLGIATNGQTSGSNGGTQKPKERADQPSLGPILQEPCKLQSVLSTQVASGEDVKEVKERPGHPDPQPPSPPPSSVPGGANVAGQQSAPSSMFKLWFSDQIANIRTNPHPPVSESQPPAVAPVVTCLPDCSKPPPKSTRPPVLLPPAPPPPTSLRFGNFPADITNITKSTYVPTAPPMPGVNPCLPQRMPQRPPVATTQRPPDGAAYGQNPQLPPQGRPPVRQPHGPAQAVAPCGQPRVSDFWSELPQQNILQTGPPPAKLPQVKACPGNTSEGMPSQQAGFPEQQPTWLNLVPVPPAPFPQPVVVPADQDAQPTDNPPSNLPEVRKPVLVPPPLFVSPYLYHFPPVSRCPPCPPPPPNFGGFGLPEHSGQNVRLPQPQQDLPLTLTQLTAVPQQNITGLTTGQPSLEHTEKTTAPSSMQIESGSSKDSDVPLYLRWLGHPHQRSTSGGPQDQGPSKDGSERHSHSGYDQVDHDSHGVLPKSLESALEQCNKSVLEQLAQAHNNLMSRDAPLGRTSRTSSLSRHMSPPEDPIPSPGECDYMADDEDNYADVSKAGDGGTASMSSPEIVTSNDNLLPKQKPRTKLPRSVRVRTKHVPAADSDSDVDLTTAPPCVTVVKKPQVHRSAPAKVTAEVPAVDDSSLRGPSEIKEDIHPEDRSSEVPPSAPEEHPEKSTLLQFGTSGLVGITGYSVDTQLGKGVNSDVSEALAQCPLPLLSVAQGAKTHCRTIRSHLDKGQCAVGYDRSTSTDTTAQVKKVIGGDSCSTTGTFGIEPGKHAEVEVAFLTPDSTCSEDFEVPSDSGLNSLEDSHPTQEGLKETEEPHVEDEDESKKGQLEQGAGEPSSTEPSSPTMTTGAKPPATVRHSQSAESPPPPPAVTVETTAKPPATPTTEPPASQAKSTTAKPAAQSVAVQGDKEKGERAEKGQAATSSKEEGSHSEQPGPVITLWKPSSIRHRATLEAFVALPAGRLHLIGNLICDGHAKEPSILGEKRGKCCTMIGLWSDGSEVTVKKLDFAACRMEIRALASLPTDLEHDNILLHKKCYVAGNWAYVVYPLCERNIRDFIAFKGERMEMVAEAKRISLQMLEGLEYLHSRGIVHGRLKPENVLLSADATVKLSHYGRIPNTDGQAACWQPTEWHQQVGKRRAVLDQRSDIQVAGMLIHYLTTSRHPWGKTEAEAAIRLQQGAEMNINDVTLLMLTSMLNTDPDSRPSAQQCLNHFWFWSKEKRLQFLCQVSKELSGDTWNTGRAVHTDQKLRDKINNIKLHHGNKLIKDWRDEINSRLKWEMVRLQGGQAYTDQITDLLKFIEHVTECRHLLSADQQANVGEVEHYMLSRFPTLTYGLFTALHGHRLAGRLALHDFCIGE